jgi:polysaccharide pyruvyl transferase WcaK-like protein
MRVGLFGLLGAGNIGNDGSLEAVLAYLRECHPEAELACLCSGPDVVARRYGLPTTPLYWYYARRRRPNPLSRVAMKASGKVRDALRLLRWVRRQDVVIVPGTGVLENTLPVRPWGFPFSMFLLCLFGRLTGTKVALVNVGSNVIRQPLVRALYRSAARMAHYRSFRDHLSRDAMREMGVPTAYDDIYPDLVFALPAPPAAAEPGTVGVGVMDFHGSSDDRRDAERIFSSYVDAMKALVRRLVDEGRRVRLLTGDELDHPVAAEVLADVRANRPDLDPAAVVFEPTATLGELLRQLAAVDVVVGTRYHNVVCALKLGKPTVSISYSAKSDRIMGEMGLGEFTQDARSVDVDLLVEQLATVERQAGWIRPMLAERAAARAAELADQYAVLTARLFPAAGPVERPASTRSAS